MLFSIIILIVIIFAIIVVYRILTKYITEDITIDIFRDCINHIDDIQYDRSYLNVHYFKYENYELVLWIPGYVTIRDLKNQQHIEAFDNDISYELGNLLKQKINES